MRIVAESEHDRVVGVPAVVGMGIVAVEPPLAVIVALGIEDVRVAVGVGCVQGVVRATAR